MSDLVSEIFGEDLSKPLCDGRPQLDIVNSEDHSRSETEKLLKGVFIVAVGQRSHDCLGRTIVGADNGSTSESVYTDRYFQSRCHGCLTISERRVEEAR